MWLLLWYLINILGYPSKYWNYTSKKQFGWLPHSPNLPAQWITFLPFISQKLLLNTKDVDFDFRMGGILVVMQSKKNAFFFNKKTFFFKNIIQKKLFFMFFYYLQFKGRKVFLILWSAYSCNIQVVKHYITLSIAFSLIQRQTI